MTAARSASARLPAPRPQGGPVTTVHAAPPVPATDPRDPEDQLQRVFDAESMSLLVTRDAPGVMAARGPA